MPDKHFPANIRKLSYNGYQRLRDEEVNDMDSATALTKASCGDSILRGKRLARYDLELRASGCLANLNAPSRCVLRQSASAIGAGSILTPVHQPCRLITVPAKLAMVQTANRNRELVTELAAYPDRLGTVRFGEVRSGHRPKLNWTPA
jgi:hypothetical protein